MFVNENIVKSACVFGVPLAWHTASLVILPQHSGWPAGGEHGRPGAGWLISEWGPPGSWQELARRSRGSLPGNPRGSACRTPCAGGFEARSSHLVDTHTPWVPAVRAGPAARGLGSRWPSAKWTSVPGDRAHRGACLCSFPGSKHVPLRVSGVAASFPFEVGLRP